jgi:hypothetical protein
VAHLNPRPEIHMAPMNSNKDTKRMVGGTSGSALSDMTRRPPLRRRPPRTFHIRLANRVIKWQSGAAKKSAAKR